MDTHTSRHVTSLCKIPGDQHIKNVFLGRFQFLLTKKTLREQLPWNVFKYYSDEWSPEKVFGIMK